MSVRPTSGWRIENSNSNIEVQFLFHVKLYIFTNIQLSASQPLLVLKAQWSLILSTSDKITFVIELHNSLLKG